MILQALTQYYEDLLKLGEITPPGWSKASVSHALDIDDGGSLLALYDLRNTEQSGKKTRISGKNTAVPASETRSSGVAANFLCDNSSYFLGIDAKGKPERTAKCFAASKELHLKLLGDVNSPAAKAVCAYFNSWQPSAAAEHPALKASLDDVMKASNIVFYHNGEPVLEDEAIKQAWQQNYKGSEPGAEEAVCLITGKRGPTARLHPNFKGVWGAQSSGAALVSFNEAAFCSYGHEQGGNSPTGKYAAFAYGEALKHLLADTKHICRIGDTTMVCWASGGHSAYQDFTLDALYSNNYYEERDIIKDLSSLAKGESIDWNDSRLNPATQFYVLGLAPNAARLSVKFFWQNSFGALAANVQRHYNDLEIVRPVYDTRPTLSVWRLALETTRSKKGKPEKGGDAKAESSSISDVNPRLAGDLFQAILTGGKYPATLLNGVALRIRAERDITRGKAAIIKAYYLRNSQNNSQNTKLKEVLTVELNDQSSYTPYVLGRLFSVLEAVQEASQGSDKKLNTTIKDRYFNSASATPATVFPTLIRLSQAHLGKLKDGDRIYYNKLITELFSRITQGFPKRLNLEQQGAFQIGYYHQTQKRYAKKEEK